LLLDVASNYIWTTSAFNPNESNSSLTYYMHLGTRTSSTARVTGSLLTQILTEPAFNILRTREQLGYIVLCSSWVLAGSGCSGIRIVVQSERGPAYLESRVDAFLDGMKTVIEEMKDEEFEEQKNGLERKLTEKVKTLGEETNIFWTHIDSGYLDFFRREYTSFLRCLSFRLLTSVDVHRCT
jgi:insulysin